MTPRAKLAFGEPGARRGPVWLPALVLALSLMPASAHSQVASPSADRPAPAGVPLAEDDRLRLFRSTFGDKGNDPSVAPHQILAVPLFIGGIAAAPVQAKTDPGGTNLQIQLASFVAAGRPLIEADLLARLSAYADADGFLSLDDFRREGLSARFDLQKLVLFIDPPLQLRRMQDVNVGPGPPTIGSGDVVPTANFSSYVNVFASLDYAHAGAGRNSDLQANLALDGALNIRGVVLEGSLMYSESAHRPLQRGDVRLVWDDPARALRYSAGDLNYAVAGFQAFVPMAGFSLARNFTLQPYFITQPAGSQEFVLNQESQVEVFVNGIQNRTLTLPAGRYNLRNFPFIEGPNDVVLRATDRVGRVTTITSPFFFSSNLLAAGVEEFSYNFGQPSFIGPDGYSYNIGLPSLSGFHRVGLSDALTVGGNFQGSLAQQQLGAEFTFASEFGTVHIDFAASHQKAIGFDGAVRLSYALIDFGRQDSGSSLLVQATYVGPNFSTLSTASPFNPTALDLGIRYTQRILTDVYASVGASYQVGRNGERNGHNLQFSLQRSFAHGLIANLRVYESVDGGGRSNAGALFAVSWQLGDGHSFVQSSYDTASDTAQASYQYSPSNFVGEPYGALNVVRRPGGDQVTGSLFYNANRFESALSHDVILPSADSDGGMSQRTSLRAATALVYADGHFGVGRPIHDSFAIVAPDKNYVDQKIILDSSGTAGRYEARTDSLGPAVLPNLSAYQVRPLSVSVPDLPIGYQLGQDHFELRPTYHSGTAIVVGNDATVVLDGTLVDRKGAPLALLAGEIVEADRKGAAALQFFTNRRGRFRIEGVKPGAFELRLVRDPGVIAHVTIPPETKGVYVVGEISLATGAEEATE